MVHGGQMANQQKSDAIEVSFLKIEFEFWHVVYQFDHLF